MAIDPDKSLNDIAGRQKIVENAHSAVVGASTLNGVINTDVIQKYAPTRATAISPVLDRIARVATPAGFALDVAVRHYDDENLKVQMEKYFNEGDIRLAKRQLERQNQAFRKAVNKEVDWGDIGGQFLSVSIGAGVGSVITAFVLPFGGLLPVVGGIVGGYKGNQIYNDKIVEQKQDPVVINLQIAEMVNNRDYVPQGVVFAALASNLEGEHGKMASKLLEKYTGEKTFAAALSDHENIAKLRAMSQDPRIADAIRAQTGMIYDPHDPFKTVDAQYAELINGGHMKPKNLFNPGEGIYVLSTMKVNGQASDMNYDVNSQTPLSPPAQTTLPRGVNASQGVGV
ncbi:MAG: hypothetical protein R3D71_07440 [Rickettsiales bacterium]